MVMYGNKNFLFSSLLYICILSHKLEHYKDKLQIVPKDLKAH